MWYGMAIAIGISDSVIASVDVGKEETYQDICDNIQKLGGVKPDRIIIVSGSTRSDDRPIFEAALELGRDYN